MTDKKPYYKLDEIGIIGKQETKSNAATVYRNSKTGEFFRKVRASDPTPKSRRLSKAS